MTLTMTLSEGFLVFSTKCFQVREWGGENTKNPSLKVMVKVMGFKRDEEILL